MEEPYFITKYKLILIMEGCSLWFCFCKTSGVADFIILSLASKGQVGMGFWINGLLMKAVQVRG